MREERASIPRHQIEEQDDNRGDLGIEEDLAMHEMIDTFFDPPRPEPRRHNEGELHNQANEEDSMNDDERRLRDEATTMLYKESRKSRLQAILLILNLQATYGWSETQA